MTKSYSKTQHDSTKKQEKTERKVTWLKIEKINAQKQRPDSRLHRADWSRDD